MEHISKATLSMTFCSLRSRTAAVPVVPFSDDVDMSGCCNVSVSDAVVSITSSATSGDVRDNLDCPSY
jgi:hypothetical protein